ncbi:LLM class flavin-dependent oxidoreductase [Halobaculum sp. MBLA0143]|uniref:LLM class flavin-dependent oxidoreductase n=1 Tax=Halobaculum sp. MBLA0143 TaxID=3079933 RepID=UPI003526766E
MVTIGCHCEGFIGYPTTEYDNGYVGPDSDLAELRESHRRATETQVEMAVAAEEFGYDFVVHSENHFDPLVQTAPDPLLVQAFVAARTDEIRLLQAAISLPQRDPVRLAEQAATIDVLSGGRLDVGVATGSGDRERALFEPEGEPGEIFDEYESLLRAAWADGPVSHEGEQSTVPPAGLDWGDDLEYSYFAAGEDRDLGSFVGMDGEETVQTGLHVTPLPQQRPRPQMWQVTVSPDTAAGAARRGANVCTYCQYFDDLAEMVDRYHEAAAAADWPDRRPSLDGEPFGRGWDPQRRRGVVAEIQCFDTSVASESEVDEWRTGQEVLLSVRRSSASEEQAASIPIDADAVIESGDAPIVGDTDHLVERFSELASVCDYDDLAIIPSVVVPGLSRSTRLEQYESFADRVAPRLP